MGTKDKHKMSMIIFAKGRYMYNEKMKSSVTSSFAMAV